MSQSIKRRMILFVFLFSALFAFAGVNFAAAQEEQETVTLVYDSNPDEVLGTFEVVLFSEELLLERISTLNANLEKMRVALGGGNVDCAAFMMGYDAILADSVFFASVPGEFAEADTLYQLTFVLALDRTRPAYFGCQNDGSVNSFDYGLAYTTLEDAIELGNRAQAVAEAVSGQVAPPPMEDDGDMGDDDDGDMDDDDDDDMDDDDDGDMGDDDDGDMTGNAITIRWTDIFSEPDPSTSTGQSLPPQTRVNVMMTDGAWSLIESALGDGYVPTNALDFDVPPMDDMPEEPDMPEVPEEPDMPEVPEDPEVPEVPEIPDDDGSDISDDEFTETVEELYLEWDGETRSPRLSSAFTDQANDPDFLRPAVVSFDARVFSIVANFSLINNAIFLDEIDAALEGESADCNLVLGAYLLIGKSPEFTNVPADYSFLMGEYESTVTDFLAVAEPAALSCLNNGSLPDSGTLTDIREATGETFANFFALAIAVDAQRTGFIME